MRKYKFLCPVTEEETYRNLLLKSNDINSQNIEVITGARHAAIAFNQSLSKLKSTSYDVAIFVHQDVYLPSGWLAKLDEIINHIEYNAEWGVLGVAGIDLNGQPSCSLWCSAINTFLNDRTSEFDEVQSLDEVLLIINLKKDIIFDENLEGFHLFGTSLVQDLITKNIKSFSIDNAIIHHDKKKSSLGRSYRVAYSYLKKKFKHRLPLHNTVMPITKYSFPLHMREIKLKFRPIKEEEYALIDPRKLSSELGLE
jgi:hypothetical protein